MHGDYWPVLIGLLAAACVVCAVFLVGMWAGIRRETSDYEGAHRVRRSPDRTSLVSQEHRPGPPWGGSSWE